MATSVNAVMKDLMDRSPLVDHVVRSVWGAGQKAVRPKRLQRYLSDTDLVRLMIGAGPTAHPGWIATDLTPTRPDVIFLNAGEPFPFVTGSVDRIHTEHMIEHVDFPTGQFMLAECGRVLKPGGRIRVATPDYDTMVRLATGPLDAEVEPMIRASNGRHDLTGDQAGEAIFVVNRMFSGHGHRFLYSEDLLSRSLVHAGLAAVTRFEAGETDDPEFAGLDAHGNQVGSDWNRYHTLILEAEKPAAR
jgi:SAM-dependent methyltransferase